MDFLTKRAINIPAGFVHTVHSRTDWSGKQTCIEAEVSAGVLSRIIDLAVEENR